MANGNKRAKLRKMMSPTPTPDPVPAPAVDEDLMDDLFAELDNRSPAVQEEAAKVLHEVEVTSGAAAPSPPPNSSKSSKQRFKEREVCKIASI